ncbi:MAG: hypothetical protein M3406_04010 [Chloroflexota bacterium]|nr:hypothetical protein [Chloroflexota bacterium]
MIPVALAVMAALATGCATGAAPSTESVRSSAPVAAATPAPSTDLNGTYRWTLTQEDADKVGDRDTGYPSTNTITLQDGELEGGCFGAAGGTYEVAGDQITFYSREYDDDATVTFTLDEDGSLHLTPVQPMDPGDAFQCFSKPWTKIE